MQISSEIKDKLTFLTGNLSLLENITCLKVHQVFDDLVVNFLSFSLYCVYISEGVILFFLNIELTLNCKFTDHSDLKSCNSFYNFDIYLLYLVKAPID